MRTVDVVKYREGGGLVTLILFTVAKGYSVGKTRGDGVRGDDLERDTERLEFRL